MKIKELDRLKYIAWLFTKKRATKEEVLTEVKKAAKIFHYNKLSKQTIKCKNFERAFEDLLKAEKPIFDLLSNIVNNL